MRRPLAAAALPENAIGVFHQWLKTLRNPPEKNLQRPLPPIHRVPGKLFKYATTSAASSALSRYAGIGGKHGTPLGR
jgi:hypothetical protein